MHITFMQQLKENLCLGHLKDNVCSHIWWARDGDVSSELALFQKSHKNLFDIPNKIN